MKRFSAFLLSAALLLSPALAVGAEEKFPPVKEYPGYADVKEADWFYDNAKLCYEIGIMTGTDIGFEPNKTLTGPECAALAARLREGLTGLGITSFTLQGSTSKEKRAQLVRDFNAGGVSVFLISLKAGGTGLNLTAADVVIHYDPWWNLSAQQQATDRAHRIGQQSQVQVYKLIAQDTIEEKILKLQEKKSALMDLITGDGEGLLSMSREELLALFE